MHPASCEFQITIEHMCIFYHMNIYSTSIILYLCITNVHEMDIQHSGVSTDGTLLWAVKSINKCFVGRVAKDSCSRQNPMEFLVSKGWVLSFHLSQKMADILVHKKPSGMFNFSHFIWNTRLKIIARSKTRKNKLRIPLPIGILCENNTPLQAQVALRIEMRLQLAPHKREICKYHVNIHIYIYVYIKYLPPSFVSLTPH